MNAALQERLKTAELLRTEALAQVPFSSVLLWRAFVKPIMFTEAIVEIFNELKGSVMMHDMKIIFPKVLSRSYYNISSRLHILDLLISCLIRVSY